MATPTTFNSDMLLEMMRAVNDIEPLPSLLVSRGMRARLEADHSANAPTFTDNPIFPGYTPRYMGLPVETFDIPPEEVFDWSGCRSPSRAKRRHARGIPQRVKITYRERAFLFDRRVLNDIAGSFDRMFDRMVVKMLYGE